MSGGDVPGSNGFSLLHDKQDRFSLSLINGTKMWNLNPKSFPDGWFHFAFTWHLETGLKCFQNGTLVGEKIMPESVTKSNTNLLKHLVIGVPTPIKNHSVPDLKMYGLAIWNRAILEEEINDNMMSGITNYVLLLF